MELKRLELSGEGSRSSVWEKRQTYGVKGKGKCRRTEVKDEDDHGARKVTCKCSSANYSVPCHVMSKHTMYGDHRCRDVH